MSHLSRIVSCDYSALKRWVGVIPHTRRQRLQRKTLGDALLVIGRDDEEDPLSTQEHSVFDVRTLHWLSHRLLIAVPMMWRISSAIFPRAKSFDPGQTSTTIRWHFVYWCLIIWRWHAVSRCSCRRDLSADISADIRDASVVRMIFSTCPGWNGRIDACKIAIRCERYFAADACADCNGPWSAHSHREKSACKQQFVQCSSKDSVTATTSAVHMFTSFSSAMMHVLFPSIMWADMSLAGYLIRKKLIVNGKRFGVLVRLTANQMTWSCVRTTQIYAMISGPSFQL